MQKAAATAIPPAPITSPEIARDAKREPLKGILLMLTASLLFAVLGLLIKIMGPGYRTWDIAAYRFIGGVLVLVAVSRQRRQLFKPANPKLMIIRGLTGSAAFVACIIAIRSLPLSTAMVLFYSFPAFAALLSPLIFGERIRLAEIGCILLALVGVAIILDFSLAGTLSGQIMAVVGAFFAGLTIAIIKKLRATHSSIMIYFYFCLIGAAICMGPFLAAPQIPRWGMDWVIIGGIVLTSVAAQLLMTTGFLYCKSWEGGLLMTSEVIFVSIFGIIFLNETPGTRLAVGSLFILTSAGAFNFFSRPAQKPPAVGPDH